MKCPTSPQTLAMKITAEDVLGIVLSHFRGKLSGEQHEFLERAMRQYGEMRVQEFAESEQQSMALHSLG